VEGYPVGVLIHNHAANLHREILEQGDGPKSALEHGSETVIREVRKTPILICLDIFTQVQESVSPGLVSLRGFLNFVLNLISQIRMENIQFVGDLEFEITDVGCEL
jgi:hypothetical protein